MAEAKEQNLQKFGHLIRKQRREIGISQEELGYRSHLDRTYVSGLERGKRNPSLTVLVQVAAGLGITVSALLVGLEGDTESE